MKLLAIMLFFLASFSAYADSLGEVVLDLNPSPENPRNSEGDFIQLDSGRIVFVYTRFSGGKDDNDAADLVSRFSDDGGRTWSAKDELVVPNEGGMNVMSVSLLRLHSGGIALFYLRKNSKHDCRLLLRQSSDEGKTWSEATTCMQEVAYFVVNNDRVIQLEDGRLLVPAARHAWDTDKRREHRGVAVCFYSDDDGATWMQSISELEAPEESRTGLQEPGIVPLADGRLWMLSRTDLGTQWQSFSGDRGETWSAPEASGISSPVSPASIERIPGTDNLLMLWNDHNNIAPELKAKRTPFTLGVSKDSGATWNTHTLEDNPNGWYCYTAVEFTKDAVLLGYCAGDKDTGGLNRTRIRRIPLAEL